MPSIVWLRRVLKKSCAAGQVKLGALPSSFYLAVTVSGLTIFIAQLFPWPILAAMIAYVSIGVGMATLRRVDARYLSVVLLGFVLPAGAVVAAALNSALPALQLSAANPGLGAPPYGAFWLLDSPGWD